MRGFVDWAAELLMSRGALVEREQEDALKAMVAPEVARVLNAEEWLALRFAGPGCDDEGDWLDRFARLLPPPVAVAGARFRRAHPVPVVDCAAVLDHELVVQNGIWRLEESFQETARYYFFTFQYTVESDDTAAGLTTVCVNASAGSLVAHPESMLNGIRNGIEEEPEFSPDEAELKRVFPIAVRRARIEAGRAAEPIGQTADRRLARDSDRVQTYYRGLLAQIEKRIARQADDAAAGRERSRAAATRLDCAAKLEDLSRRYAVRIRVALLDVLAVSLPVRAISTRVIRKKIERSARFHWNPIVSALDSPWCEGCLDRARPLFLCDERAHFLCSACAPKCPMCRRPSGQKG